MASCYLLLLLLVFLSSAVSEATSCHPDDLRALRGFAGNLGGDRAVLLRAAWTGSSCCSWEGVDCDGARGRVTALWLPRRGLMGHMPGASLAGLAWLKSLNLANNKLVGTIPSWIGELEHLCYLDLSHNSLVGEVPMSLIRLNGLNNQGCSPADADQTRPELSGLHRFSLRTRWHGIPRGIPAVRPRAASSVQCCSWRRVPIWLPRDLGRRRRGRHGGRTASRGRQGRRRPLRPRRLRVSRVGARDDLDLRRRVLTSPTTSAPTARPWIHYQLRAAKGASGGVRDAHHGSALLPTGRPTSGLSWRGRRAAGDVIGGLVVFLLVRLTKCSSGHPRAAYSSAPCTKPRRQSHTRDDTVIVAPIGNFDGKVVGPSPVRQFLLSNGMLPC